MAWLNYTDDEVSCFHPAFREIGDAALHSLGLAGQLSWEHHPPSNGISVVPDFVLVDTATGRWIVVVEIKRTTAAVFSTRNQIQAKGYAETNKDRFRPEKPKFFCVSNFEATLLFALHGESPPSDCRIKGMEFMSGSFLGPPEPHRDQLLADLKQVVQHVVEGKPPTFEAIWAKLGRELVGRAGALPFDPCLSLALPPIPDVVSSYFAGRSDDIVKREALLRCLTADYLRGQLSKHFHPRAKSTPALRPSVRELAGLIDYLRTVDFSGLFEPDAAEMYRNLPQPLKGAVEKYVEELIAIEVNRAAEGRGDALEFPDAIMAELYPLDVQDRRGKVQTDPDLAYLLARLSIGDGTGVVLDPGCGDGNLLSAAYDVLRAHGLDHAQTVDRVVGIDADPLVTKIAALRLVLKEPRVVSRDDPCKVRPGDMFSSANILEQADVILMNPPFKRYEAQDDAPIPDALRAHYRQQIESLSSLVETDSGQANIYNLYVEFVIKACKPGTHIGIVLDNRWYHNRVAEQLRRLLLRECEILAVVEYPHDAYFKDWIIATSLLVVRKGRTEQNSVQFIRTNDPRRADFSAISAAMRGTASFPSGWRVNAVPQSELDAGSWKRFFFSALENEFRADDWPTIDRLFEYGRRGSLEKEGGGVELFEFPFERPDYGPRRRAKAAPRPRFKTDVDRKLTAAENLQLRRSADAIPPDCRGYALRKADDIEGFLLSANDVTQQQTLEFPSQRTAPLSQGYFSDRRCKWTEALDAVVEEIEDAPEVAAYAALVENTAGLGEGTLTRSELWNALREPYAGELIIPRKLRNGHRVHINRFAYLSNGRQVRLSSNFLSYSRCKAVDEQSGLDRETAVLLIFAFLMSSFGQLQFELVSNNREGARSIEQNQLEQIRIFDPRWIRPESRQEIIETLGQLPYPVPTDCPPETVAPLSHLDSLLAEEIVHRHDNLNANELVTEVHQALFEWTQARCQ